MPRFYGTRELHWRLSFYSLHHGRCEMSVYHDVQTASGQEKSLQSEKECTKPRGDLIDTHCWHIKWRKTGLDRKKKNSVPYGYKTDRQVWIAHSTHDLMARPLPTNSKTGTTNRTARFLTQTCDSTIWPKQFYLQPNSRPSHVPSYFAVLCTSCFPKISYAFLLSFNRVTRPVHRDVLHVTTLTKLDGLTL